MLSTLKKILIVLLVAVAGLAIYISLRPADYRVDRKMSMKAPPSKVFEHLNDFRKWEDWSPWAKIDKNATATFEGPEKGKGAVFKWAGNSEVGKGKMEILESEPDKLVRIKLDFIEPREGTGTTEFTLVPKGEDTEVTWSMYGKHDFMGKAVCLFMNLDKMIGEKYEEGLANIKKVVEKQ
jgi:uncharacterized protein YndB with AHSA1/START domain